MSLVVSNFERSMRIKLLTDTWKNIQSFSRSKNLATTQNRRRAVLDVASMLSQRHIKLLRIYFSRYKLTLDDRM